MPDFPRSDTAPVLKSDPVVSGLGAPTSGFIREVLAEAVDDMFSELYAMWSEIVLKDFCSIIPSIDIQFSIMPSHCDFDFSHSLCVKKDFNSTM